MKIKREPKSEVSFLGLNIQRKTDVLALTAFVISLLTGAAQLIDWVKGPQITLYPPERVVIYTYLQSGGTPTVRVAAPMSYTNTAPAQYAATIKAESVDMRVGPVLSHQKWLSFAQLRRDGSRFAPQIVSDASPFPIPGGSSVSHSTLFSPFPSDCAPRQEACARFSEYISEDDFTNSLDAGRINLTFTSEVYGGSAQSVDCYVELDETVKTLWLANGAVTAQCRFVPQAHRLPGFRTD